MSVPIVGRKLTPLRWEATIVARCECSAQSILILHDGPVPCPSCGLIHQFASFDLRGEPVLPAELGLRTASFSPKASVDRAD